MIIPTLTKAYVIDWAEELGWAILVSIGLTVGPMLLTASDQLGVYGADDWKTWGLTLGVAVGRVTLAVVGNAIRQLVTAGPDPDELSA